ncbi:MAG: SO_0444 family Cu/Zn efflux transporter, partial [Lentisphaerae bacterium]|nr:SO_0444 family Cu/Zn efflux transporter [Lentisphaerota bacterium]
MNLIITITADFWMTLSDMAPYLLFGFAVAGVLSILISTKFIEKHLGGQGLGPVIKASFFGVPLPLCSCSVIPVAASLRRHGASKAATTSFLISTPQTGVDSIMATLSLLGPVFAVFRPVAAFLAGVIGGLIVQATGNRNETNQSPEECKDSCCAKEKKPGIIVRIFRHGFITLPRDIALPLLVGTVAAGFISALVPNDFFSGVLGTGIAAMLVMMLLGLPMYVCATASIPIAVAMMAKGVTPGAALVFLMTGPATNAASLSTV